MKNGLSVKEYASLHGMTEQAVYKRIRAGKLQTTERQENGKKKLYILLDSSETVSGMDTATPAAARAPDLIQEDAAAAGDLPDPGRAGSHPGRAGGRQGAGSAPQEDAAAAGDLPDPDRAGSHPGHGSAGQGAGSAPPAEIAALEKALEALTAQLKEKDRQIERLTELLYREQGLQQQSHMLLNAATPAAARAPDLIQEDAAAAGDLPDPGRQEPKAEQPKEQKKRSFWNWLFN